MGNDKNIESEKEKALEVQGITNDTETLLREYENLNEELKNKLAYTEKKLEYVSEEYSYMYDKYSLKVSNLSKLKIMMSVTLLIASIVLLIWKQQKSSDLFKAKIEYSDGYPKDEIFSEVIYLSINCDDYDEFKYLFETSFDSKFYKRPLFPTLNSEIDFYQMKPSLTTILKDVRSKYFRELNDSVFIDSQFVTTRTELINTLNIVIDENEKRNPYDGLSDEQVFLLEQVKEKLIISNDSLSGNIPPELEKLSQELKNQRMTIDKYLNNSEESFKLSDKAYKITLKAMVISIIALVLTAFQFFSWIWSLIVGFVNFCKDVISFAKNKKNSKDDKPAKEE